MVYRESSHSNPYLPPKGNISLIMLFVLAIGSVIGLMSTHRLQSMIRETSAMKV